MCSYVTAQASAWINTIITPISPLVINTRAETSTSTSACIHAGVCANPAKWEILQSLAVFSPGMAQYVLGLMKDGNAGKLNCCHTLVVVVHTHTHKHTHTHTHTHTHSLKWWHIHSVTPASCVINRKLKMGKN